MSLTIGVISKNRGWIFSDGRSHTPYELENGQLKNKSEVSSDCFDKTFHALNKAVIGSAIGLLNVGSAKTIDLIKDFINQQAKNCSLADLLSNLSSYLLNIVRPLPILEKSKELEIIIIKKQSGYVTMGIIEIRYASDRLDAKVAVTDRGDNTYIYNVFGDHAAQNVLMEELAASLTPRTPGSEVKSIAKKAVAKAIAASNKHPFGEQQSCGGKTFERFV